MSDEDNLLRNKKYDRESYSAMWLKLNHATQRCSELALENTRLKFALNKIIDKSSKSYSDQFVVLKVDPTSKKYTGILLVDADCAEEALSVEGVKAYQDAVCLRIPALEEFKEL